MILRILFCKIVYNNFEFKFVKYLELKVKCVKICIDYIFFFFSS